ncbi:hypothetical protein KCU89_g43, partial [Aureobasidium melanogenum]
MIGGKTRFGFNNPNAEMIFERARTTPRFECCDSQQKMSCHRHQRFASGIYRGQSQIAARSNDPNAKSIPQGLY